MPGLQGKLGDAGPHRPGADDADDIDLVGRGSGHGQTGLIDSNGWRQSLQ